MTRSTNRRLLVLIIMGCVLFVAIRPFLGDAQQSTPVAATPVGSPEASLMAEGEQIFSTVCMACHQAGGAGIQGVYPMLAGNPLVTLDDPTYITQTVLYGRGGMPRFGDIFSDEQIAAVVSYVRGGLPGNTAAPIDADFVASVRVQNEGTPVPADESDVGQKGEGDLGEEATPTP